MINTNYNVNLGKSLLAEANRDDVIRACRKLGRCLNENKPERSVKINGYTSLSTVKTPDDNSLYNLVLNIKQNNSETIVNSSASKPLAHLKKYLTKNCAQAAADIKDDIIRMLGVIKKQAMIN